MSSKNLKWIIAILILLAIANWLPTHSGEYLEEQFVNYDKPVSRRSVPGNEERILAMTSQEVADQWQLVVTPH